MVVLWINLVRWVLVQTVTRFFFGIATAAATTTATSSSDGIANQIGSLGFCTNGDKAFSDGIANQFGSMGFCTHGDPECSVSEVTESESSASASDATNLLRLERIRERIAFAPEIPFGNLPPNPTQAEIVAAAAAAAAVPAKYVPSAHCRRGLQMRRR